MTTKYHGVSAVPSQEGVFNVKLTVNGVQTYVGRIHGTEEEAARAYDAALFRLLAFTSNRAVPNFPKDFDSVDIQKASEIVNRAYQECSLRASENGIDVDDLRFQRENQIRSGTPNPEKLFESRIDQVKKFANAAFKLNIKFRQQIGQSFSTYAKTIPLAKRREDIMSQLQKVATDLDAYVEELKQNQV